jgi:hypothetical protein
MGVQMPRITAQALKPFMIQKIASRRRNQVRMSVQRVLLGSAGRSSILSDA